ncbi:molybdopterin molybdotransferase [Rhizobium multihospitium]|uniref:Molybdopterin molybdenumtransferase n=2 Tax=Rhizobium multihospitium TaxID=410764 RepID=A0A1C3W072_9HYPH|nr:molybdopterin molybdotransferase [Rhizobium multihospitium]
MPISPDMAAARASALVLPVMKSERLELLAAMGRILARVPVAETAVPPFDNSAMDGYAINAGELIGTGPWTVPIIGIAAAGTIVRPEPGTCRAIRILTGAALPSGFDTVIMQERCERKGDTVTIFERPRPGQNVKRAGEDVQEGQALLEIGDVLTPERLPLLAGAGVASVEVFRRIRVAVLCTGSELRSAGEPLGAGQIYNSNGILVSAMLREHAWIEVEELGIVRDNRQLITEIIQKAARNYDVTITTGGVSAGDEDHVAAAVIESGGSLDVVKVAMRPGKPLKIGRIGISLFAGLPGNPNAALVCLRYIVLPALRKMAAKSEFGTKWFPAISASTYPKRADRTEFVPFRTVGHNPNGLPLIVFLGQGSSASLSAIAMAEGIARLPSELSTMEPGVRIDVDFFRRS